MNNVVVGFPERPFARFLQIEEHVWEDTNEPVWVVYLDNEATGEPRELKPAIHFKGLASLPIVGRPIAICSAVCFQCQKRTKVSDRLHNAIARLVVAGIFRRARRKFPLIFQ